jgi:hypothetical protein
MANLHNAGTSGHRSWKRQGFARIRLRGQDSPPRCTRCRRVEVMGQIAVLCCIFMTVSPLDLKIGCHFLSRNSFTCNCYLHQTWRADKIATPYFLMQSLNLGTTGLDGLRMSI